ncbi:hypothetical protein RRG08_066462 [Elysia crispata]|uniref:Uncharacterized protein n=1 Tax=Elysia crispata TaxID=231223 RepID=A0AAE0Y2K6_9GAST|nr:hypothetical protein RRG08_066462 [Elysia crispata]
MKNPSQIDPERSDDPNGLGYISVRVPSLTSGSPCYKYLLSHSHSMEAPSTRLVHLTISISSLTPIVWKRHQQASPGSLFNRHTPLHHSMEAPSTRPVHLQTPCTILYLWFTVPIYNEVSPSIL